ncbi:MAG: urease accessory protein UreD [Verrucomicrobiota bacterium]
MLTDETVRDAVRGGLRLRYEVSGEAETNLAQQWVRPPMHLAKVYHEDGWATNLLTSPTAGLLSGDLLEVDVELGPDTRVALISPAACRVHTMETGHAEVVQHYSVGENATLDVWPAPIMLQAGASLKQTTRLDVAASAQVLFCEIVSPGRAAHGESFAFESWRSRFEIYCGGKLSNLENFDCRPAFGDAENWKKLYPNASYACIYLLAEDCSEQIVHLAHKLETPDAALGASMLNRGGVSFKVLAGDGIALRKCIFQLRELAARELEISLPRTVRRAQTFFY